jgi:hypothetical protein
MPEQMATDDDKSNKCLIFMAFPQFTGATHRRRKMLALLPKNSRGRIG